MAIESNALLAKQRMGSGDGAFVFCDGESLQENAVALSRTLAFRPLVRDMHDIRGNERTAGPGNLDRRLD